MLAFFFFLHIVVVVIVIVMGHIAASKAKNSRIPE